MQHNKLLEKFREFYFRNYPDDMELQIEYFSIFGGLDIDVDTSYDISHQFQKNILDNFEPLNKLINEITLNNKENKRLLHALAIGDRRIFFSFHPLPRWNESIILSIFSAFFRPHILVVMHTRITQT